MPESEIQLFHFPELNFLYEKVFFIATMLALLFFKSTKRAVRCR